MLGRCMPILLTSSEILLLDAVDMKIQALAAHLLIETDGILVPSEDRPLQLAAALLLRLFQAEFEHLLAHALLAHILRHEDVLEEEYPSPFVCGVVVVIDDVANRPVS